MWPKWGSKFDKMQKKIDLSRRRAKGKHAKRMRCFPSFFLIGFTKCGTTDLYETLSFIPVSFIIVTELLAVKFFLKSKL